MQLTTRSNNWAMVVLLSYMPGTFCLSYFANNTRISRQNNLEIEIGIPGSSNSNPTAPNTGISNNNLLLVKGVGCGTVPIVANQIIQIQSTNFGVDNYFNNEACTWTFKANDCALSVFCPCFNVPSSLGCLEDYLKIGHLHFHDKFCGENSPVGVYRASGDFLTVRFRSDYKGTGKGFLCYVRCTATGSADPVPPPMGCPPNTRNPYWNQ